MTVTNWQRQGPQSKEMAGKLVRLAGKLSPDLFNKVADWKDHPPKSLPCLKTIDDSGKVAETGSHSKEMAGKLVLLAGKLDFWGSDLWQTELRPLQQSGRLERPSSKVITLPGNDC